MAVNKNVFAGKIYKDPDVKYFESGAVLAEFDLAVRRQFAQKDGPNQDYIKVKCWGKTAETVANYVRANSELSIKGELEIESWTDKTTGKLRTKAVITARSLTLLGGRGKKEQSRDDEYPEDF